MPDRDLIRRLEELESEVNGDSKTEGLKLKVASLEQTAKFQTRLGWIILTGFLAGLIQTVWAHFAK